MYPVWRRPGKYQLQACFERHTILIFINFYMRTMDSKINTRIRQTRLLKGYSQEYMAYRLNISQQSYSRMESGRQDLKIMQLETIAEVLEIPLTDLLSDYSRQYVPVDSENVMPLLNELESVLKRLMLAGKAST